MVKIDKEAIKTVYSGEIRAIIRRENKSPFGFICNHNFSESEDIFFSFRCIEGRHPLSDNDLVSFKVVEQEGKIWAINVRSLRKIEEGDDNEKKY